MDWYLCKFSLQFLWNFQLHFGYFNICWTPSTLHPPLNVSRSTPSPFTEKREVREWELPQLSAANPPPLSSPQIKAHPLFPFLCLSRNDPFEPATSGQSATCFLDHVPFSRLVGLAVSLTFLSDVSPTFPCLFLLSLWLSPGLKSSVSCQIKLKLTALMLCFLFQLTPWM